MTLWILVEGDDDLRFFQRLFMQTLSKKHNTVKFWRYSCQKNEKRLNVIRAIGSMKQQYIYVADIDESPCVTDKKQRISRQLDGKILDANVAVVIKEIEGWYLAGASSKVRILLDFHIQATDATTKEQFDKLVPAGMPRAQLMEEILDDFDLRIAPTRNRSLEYFVRKWVD